MHKRTTRLGCRRIHLTRRGCWCHATHCVNVIGRFIAISVIEKGTGEDLILLVWITSILTQTYMTLWERVPMYFKVMSRAGSVRHITKALNRPFGSNVQ